MNRMIEMTGTVAKQEGKKNRSRMEALLNLTESIATLTIAGSFLLLVAACLANL